MLLPALAVIATALAAAAVPSTRPASGPPDRQAPQAHMTTAAHSTTAVTEPGIFLDPAPAHRVTVSAGSTARIEAALRRELRARPRLLARFTRRSTRRISLGAPAGPGPRRHVLVRLRFVRLRLVRLRLVRLRFVRLRASRTVASTVTTYLVTTRTGRAARLVIVSADHLAGERPMTMTTDRLRCLAQPVILLLAAPAERTSGPGADTRLRRSLRAAACARPGERHGRRYRG